MHTSMKNSKYDADAECYSLGVARFIDASIYRDTFLAIRIAILFFLIAIFFFLIIFLMYFNFFFFFFPQ